MATPIDPKGSLQELNKELNQYIKMAEQGKGDPKALFKLEKEMKALAENQEIPSNVRQSLQSALQNLKAGGSDDEALISILSAQAQVQAAVGGGVLPPLNKTKEK